MSDNVPDIGSLTVPRLRGQAAKQAFVRGAALQLISALPDTPDGNALGGQCRLLLQP